MKLFGGGALDGLGGDLDHEPDLVLGDHINDIGGMK